MIITAQNGIQYEIRCDSLQNIEIERDDENTGMRKVFVFQDFSLGNFDSARKETIFYSYDIQSNGERINQQRHNFYDSKNEFQYFSLTELWNQISQLILTEFFMKIEFTSLGENNNEFNTDDSQ